MKIKRGSIALLAMFTFQFACVHLSAESADQILSTGITRTFVTNVAAFRNLSDADYLGGCDFQLSGVITLLDAKRNLIVLQDSTGAVGIHSHLTNPTLRAGQLATLRGENTQLFVPEFPDYPHFPTEQHIDFSFEWPPDFNEYRLTRMRGLLRPPASGEYVFWIASDNSSELWLSPNSDPSKARKIGSIPRFGYVSPREWTRYPSQRSEPILLKAGESYYVEALCEQNISEELLSVAWQGPGISQSVIDGHYLTPWGFASGTTNGILRECWDNFSAGDLEGISGARAYESAVTVKSLRVINSLPGKFPKPDRLVLNQFLRPDENFRWVQVEGVVDFIGTENGMATFELSDAEATVQVRAQRWNSAMPKTLGSTRVRVEGVCEGVLDQNGALIPGLVWAPTEACIRFLEPGPTNEQTAVTNQADEPTATNSPTMQGFYGTRGVVTFNDRAFGTDYTFVQEDSATVLVSLTNCSFKNDLEVGQWVDLGGALAPGKYVSVLTPLALKKLGWHAMPAPVAQPIADPAPGSTEGRWSEFEGIVHSVNTNGALAIVTKDGPAYLWIGQIASDQRSRLVDAKLRARGVLMLTLLNAPLLLSPSRQFVDVEREPPDDPFTIPPSPIAALPAESLESQWLHRVRVIGEVTYRDAQSFFVQDATGGIRVRADSPAVEIGRTIEVVAFPASNGFAVTEPLMRAAVNVQRVTARELDLSEPFSPKQNGLLGQITATLLAQRSNGVSQVLELQNQQRIFTATYAGADKLPEAPPGSTLRITGVCDGETAAALPAGEKSPRAQILSSLNLLLRSPQDVTIVSGPPWWTWQRTATLVGILLLIVITALLWVHLLRTRLARQQAAQLNSSRQVLKRLEDERQRIAVNLHDSLGQILLAIKNHALLAIQRPPDEQGWRQRLGEISEISSQAIEEVRQITHGLRPYQLDRLGLTQAIRTLINQASVNSSISFASRVEDVDNLFGKDAEIHVYRIVQEAVANVVKHSAATEAAVVIKKRATVVSLSIRDNGRGFDPAKPSSQPHDLGYGLSGIAERVRILGGALAIDAHPGSGASLSVEVPLPIRKYDSGSIGSDCG